MGTVKARERMKTEKPRSFEETSQFDGELKRTERLSTTSIVVQEAQETAKTDFKQPQQIQVNLPRAQERSKIFNQTQAKN